jgi:hypothetical protein
MSEGAPMEIMFENDYVRVVRVIFMHGQLAPEYSPAAKPMVRIKLAPGVVHSTVMFSDSGPPEKQMCRLTKTSTSYALS